MSFLKIADSKRRDEMVKEFLETKKRIQESQLRERAGKRELKKDLGKFFKPVTDVQKSVGEDIKEELRPLKEIAPAIAAIPGPPALPGPAGLSEPTPKVDMTRLGPISAEYLTNFGDRDGTDKIFGLYSKGGIFYIGDKPVKFKDDNIFVDDKEYKGTKGLWELITADKPVNDLITNEDYNEYGKLLFRTNAIYQDNDPRTNRPRASKSYKYKNYIKPLWKNRHLFEDEDEDEDESSGSGLSDPNVLLERLDLLMESKKAGNTGVDQEIVSICDKLEKQNILNSKEYKKIVTKC